MKRAVVTGGAGFLGSHLCERLLARGLRGAVPGQLPDRYAGERRAPGSGPEGFRLVRCDVTDFVHVPGPVDLVLHFASPACPIDYLQLPIETLKVGSIGTLHALGLAKEKGARFLLASTSGGLRRPAGAPAAGDATGVTSTRSARAASTTRPSASREALTMAYRTTHDVDTGIVRIFNTYGPRMRPNDGRAIPAFVSQALRGAADHRGRRRQPDPVDLLRRRPGRRHPPAAGLRPPGPGEHRQPLRAVDAAARGADPRHRRVRLRDRVHPPSQPTIPTVRQPDITLARQVLDWQPKVELRDGLTRTINYFAEHPEVLAASV